MRTNRLHRGDARVLGAAYLLAILVCAGMTYWGRASDCTPHQIDGQCGMSTAFGELEGIVGAVIIAFAGHGVVARRRARRAVRERPWTRDR